MEIRPINTPGTGAGVGRGSGAGLRKRRSDARGPRKDIIIRLPEAVAHQLKVVAACKGITVQDYCAHMIIPQIRKDMEECGLSAEQLAR
jgi:hypothetical protein